MRSRELLLSVVLSASLAFTALPAVAGEADRQPDELTPGSAAYQARDQRNISDAYGRITGPGGQLRNPAYLPALLSESTSVTLSQLLALVASPTRLPLTAGMVVPGWNVGNPLRAG